MGSVLDAACCAGTCRTSTQIGSLDVNNVGISTSDALPLGSLLIGTLVCVSVISFNGRNVVHVADRLDLHPNMAYVCMNVAHCKLLM